jgi:mevalonate kinase
MTAIKKIEKLIDKGEARKRKLVTKIENLKQEEKALYEAVQDDFNQAILNDSEPAKKLSSDLEKVREELREAQETLSQVDAVIQNELNKQKEEVEKERRQFLADKSEEFREHFDKMTSLFRIYY